VTATDPPGPGQSLATGAAGIALLDVQRGDWTALRNRAAEMTREPLIADPEVCGLFYGAPAVAFSLHTAQQPAYTAVLDTLDGHLDALTRRRLDRAHRRIEDGALPQLREFDLISGLTGIGTYLLNRHGGGDLLRGVLAYLVRLTEPLKAGTEMLPGWWSGDSPAGQPSAQWPGGHGNLGLAHGICGPLALMSAAIRRGIEVPGQREAIDRICSHLDRWRTGTGTRAWWPGTVSRSEWLSRTSRQRGPGRPSWCYGTPGLARTQQLAALALSDPQRQQQAEQALVGCVADETQLSRLVDASLCHGWAGLMHTTRRISADSGSDALTVLLPGLRARLDQHLHQQGLPTRPGLLEGRAGVQLVQCTGATDMPLENRWDACLLLNG